METRFNYGADGFYRETWVWDVRTKHISCEPIPTVEGVRALANYGQGATLFTLGPNHTVQQYDVSHPGLVKTVQYHPMLPPPVPVKVNHNAQDFGEQQMPGTAPPMPVSRGSDSGRGPVPLSTIRANEMLAIDHARRTRSEIKSPGSISSRSESVSSIASNPRYQQTSQSISSRAASGTTFSTVSPSMMGRDSMFSGGSSIFPPTQTASMVSSGRRSKGSRLRQEVLRSPENKPSYVDLFPRTRARLSKVTYKQPQALPQDGLGPDALRKQMLDVVFGWNNDIEPLVRDELAHHDPGSTSAVLLSKWLGEVDSDIMAAAMNSGSISSSDWMLLALSSMGGQASTGKMGQAMVQKLLQQGDFHTSATILLGLGDREDAVEVYVSRSFYMEAILLTCLTFPTDWQRQAHLVRRWGEFVVENSQQQLAIRCFSCTGVDPPVPWASPSLHSQSTISQGTPSISSMLSPPTSPPPATQPMAPSRMTSKTASLKLITSFAAPEKSRFAFPGLKSDDRTPTNGPGITPIAESAISPVGTPGGFLRPQSRSKSNLGMRTATPGGYHRNRLPSIGETPIDVTLPLYPRPSALPTPDNSGSELEKESRFGAQSSDGKSGNDSEPPLLLSSARYDPGSAMPGQSPMTALPNTAIQPSILPDPSRETLIAFAEKSRARNGSRDRKPDGLHIHMPTQKIGGHLSSGGLDSGSSGNRRSHKLSSLHSNGSISGRIDSRSDTKSPSISGQSGQSAKSPSVSSRSIDQYISSLEEAGYHTRRAKGTSRRRPASREGRSQTREHKSRSKQRATDRSEDRGRVHQKYIRPAKRSPSSPVPMSPDDIFLYQDNPSADSLNAQLAATDTPSLDSRHGRDHSIRSKGMAKLRSGSKASDLSHKTAIRRRSPDGLLDSQLGSEASFTSTMMSSRQDSMVSSRQESPESGGSSARDPSRRGRSKSKNQGSLMRSPSSPLPMSPQLKYYQRSEDEDERLRLVEANRQRIRSRHRSSSRKPRERGTSARRDLSPDRRKLRDGRQVHSLENKDNGLQAPASAIEPSRNSNENFAEALAQLSQGSNEKTGSARGNHDRSDSNHKKALAARELEARRESLARRPLAPAIPHPAELSNVNNTRPQLGLRSHTDFGMSPISWGNSINSNSLQHQPQRFPIAPMNTDVGEFVNRGTSAGPYGLPATPRAMRHPKYDAGQLDIIPAVPEVPENGPFPNELFSDGQHVPELPRSMSAPIPEQSLPPIPSELPSHPAFHKALRSNARRANFSPLGDIGQQRRRPSVDLNANTPVQVGIDETLHAAESTQLTNEQPPLLPELQHLSASIPPPPPPPPAFPNEVMAHHSASSGSGLGVINIAIDDESRDDSLVIEVPPLVSQNPRSPPPPSERTTPATITRSGSNHKRGRSENFKNQVKGITDRLRSTSRGRNNTKSPHLEQTANTPSPYESVPPLYF